MDARSGVCAELEGAVLVIEGAASRTRTRKVREAFAVLSKGGKEKRSELPGSFSSQLNMCVLLAMCASVSPRPPWTLTPGC